MPHSRLQCNEIGTLFDEQCNRKAKTSCPQGRVETRAYDFTQWLRENVDVLNAAPGLNLEGDDIHLPGDREDITRSRTLAGEEGLPRDRIAKVGVSMEFPLNPPIPKSAIR
jgi:hypothetical protein